MSFKCVLAPHYCIPTPILSILVGRLPRVATTIEDVGAEAAAAELESMKLEGAKDEQGESLSSFFSLTGV